MATIKDLRPITPRTNGTRALSAIKNIARHHSATTGGNWASFWNTWKKKWGTGGYHEIILRDGTVELCYDPNEITNGVGGQNSYIYNICLVGNGSFTAAQEKAWEERARYWMQRLGLSAAGVKGHNEFPGQATSCPGINMATVRARLSGQASTASSITALKYGDTGEVVRLHQDKFKRAGYAIEVDGSFGPSMQKVVRQFQVDNGLIVDGYHGPASQAKLDEVLITLRNKPAAPNPTPPKKEVDEMTQYMDEKLPSTQQKDAADLFEKAYEDGYFSVNHAPKTKDMTRREYYDLKESLTTREKINKKVE